ncbi:hypothetical protein WEI85_11040 [Actinomycetes bacterium KLBMP 9797]
MSKRMDGKVARSFETVVEERFGPAAAEWGLAGPECDGIVIPTVEYRAIGLVYCWKFDPEERYVTVSVRRVVGDETLVCDLEDLVVTAGLGKRQQIRQNAVTLRNLHQAVESQVEWLARIHPLVTGPDAADLMRRAGAKVW